MYCIQYVNSNILSVTNETIYIPCNLAASQNPTNLGMSLLVIMQSPHGKGSTAIYVHVCTCALHMHTDNGLVLWNLCKYICANLCRHCPPKSTCSCPRIVLPWHLKINIAIMYNMVRFWGNAVVMFVQRIIIICCYMYVSVCRVVRKYYKHRKWVSLRMIFQSQVPTVFPRNLAAPRNPAALEMSPHLSANSSQ